MSTEKNKCPTWKWWVQLHLGQKEDSSHGDHLSNSSEKLLHKSEGGLRYVCDFSERKYMQSSTHFDRRSLLVPGRLLLTDVSFNDFNAFLERDDTRSCAHKIFYWKFLSIQRSVLLVFVLFCFPEHRLPHTWSLPWAPFRMYCRLTTAFDYWPNPYTGRWQGTNFSWHQAICR